jgi:hypothetical protein
MHIKSVIRAKGPKRGNPVRFNAEESLQKAVTYGIKTQNTADNVFWALLGTVKKLTISSTVMGKDKWGNDMWKATATGTVDIGKTVAATDEFHKARPHQFAISYMAGYDDLGMPDIEVTSFTVKPVQNASELASLAVDNVSRHLPKKPPKTEQEAAIRSAEADLKSK